MSIVSSVPARPALRRGYFLAAVAVLGLAGGGLAVKAMWPKAPTPPTALSIKDADGAIYRVNADPRGLLQVGVHLKNAPTTSAYVDLAGMTARAVGKALEHGIREPVDDAGEVQLAFDVPAAGAGVAPLMTLYYRVKDLKRLDYSTIQWPEVLGEADLVELPKEGFFAVHAWCASAPDDGYKFCAKAGMK